MILQVLMLVIIALLAYKVWKLEKASDKRWDNTFWEFEKIRSHAREREKELHTRLKDLEVYKSKNELLNLATELKSNVIFERVQMFDKSIQFIINNKPAYSIGDSCGKNLYVTKILVVESGEVFKYQYEAKNDKTGEVKVINN